MDFASRELVRRRAGRRCEYCCIHEDDEPYAFHLEHVIPKKHGGGDDPANLAWSCHSCNLAKGANLWGRVQDKVVALFHRADSNGIAISAGSDQFSSVRRNVAKPPFKS